MNAQSKHAPRIPLLKVYENIAAGSHPHRSFYVLVTLSTVIAGFGLLSNSAPVVIGAMLVAPLMVPIVGMAFALSVGDEHLFRDASLAEFWGVVLSVAVSYLIGSLALDVDFGPEIMARTVPTTYDIFVALAAGLAGAYSMVDERVNAALPGVAIATSLVPPLTVSGLCLAQGRMDLAGSAFLLFFANFLSIQLASAAIFIRFGFNRVAFEEDHGRITFRVLLRRFGLSFVLLVAVAAFMSKTLYAMATEKAFHRRLEAVARAEVQRRLGAQLADLRYVRDGNGSVNAVVSILTPQEYLPGDVEALEKSVKNALGLAMHITVRSLLSKDADSHGPVFMLDEDKLKREQASREARFLSEATRLLNAQLAEVPGARLADIRREQDETNQVIAVVRTPEAIAPERIKRIQDGLRETLDPTLRLIVRSVLTRDADGDHYLYEADPKEKHGEQIAGEALEFFKQLESALQTAIAAARKGAALLEFRYTQQEDGLFVLAVVSTPDNFTPKQVGKIQAGLQTGFNRPIRLVVRSVVGVDTGAEAYIPSLDESPLQKGTPPQPQPEPIDNVPEAGESVPGIHAAD
ncbi:TIGR00341 family protein [Methylomagnum ishizawai]|uniref:TIGR00341 family protein n=1 Tax=Methylomagnum ishizawai TaxID=1760988 RepID=A0A1Y6D433_9GAMM|nr:TIGR00341 family protein [Methylomagnum ishizawai]SMF97366.1 TIGR00341 family protein [Methylomagnum ishizawai]